MAATSNCEAFAVGYYNTRRNVSGTLIERWTGTAWKVPQSPNPGGPNHDNSLFGVAATSPTNAWAVGTYAKGSGRSTKLQTLVEHWNGRRWKVQPSPNPSCGRGSPRNGMLTGVAATSATNAWAVGSCTGAAPYTGGAVIEHWNGTTWKIQPSPNPGGTSHDNLLNGITATSAHNAWAVGRSGNQTLIEHWNGTAWTRQNSPNKGGGPPAPTNVLNSVAATSAHNAWGVGEVGNLTLIEHWNGKAWKVQRSPHPGPHFNFLYGVAATSAHNAWAVGQYFSPSRTLIERWNGTAWKLQPSPNPGAKRPHNQLNGVAATSSTNAWAVGSYNASKALALRWNGTAWGP